MEEDNKRYLKLGIIYSLATILLLFLIFKFGVGIAINISDLIQKGNIDSTSNLSDVIVPPPQMSSISEATNSAQLKVWGFAPANQEVEIRLNSDPAKNLPVDSEGKFEGIIDLSLGTNEVFANSLNKEGVKSAPTNTWTIFYSDTPPNLEILDPKDEKVNVRNKNFVIKGKVELTSKVYINDHSVVLGQDGSFSYPILLEKGENKFKIASVDPAQNRTEKEITFVLQ